MAVEIPTIRNSCVHRIPFEIIELVDVDRPAQYRAQDRMERIDRAAWLGIEKFADRLWIQVPIGLEQSGEFRVLQEPLGQKFMAG